MRILHTADWHTRDKDIEECQKVQGALVEKAEQIQPDLTIIAGDLTDRNDVKFDSLTARLIIKTVSGLSQFAPVFIELGTKTHDGNIPELLQEIRTHFPVYVSTYPEQLFFTGDGFQRFEDMEGYMDGKALISSVPTPTKQYLQSMDGIEQTDQQVGEAMTSIFTHFGTTARQFNMPHILVGHWQVGGAYVSETQQLIGRDIEISTDQIMSASPNIACLGHIHMAQQIRGHPIFYSGSTHRKDFGELEEKGFYVHEIAESSMVTEWHKLPSRTLLKTAYDFTDSDTPELEASLYADLDHFEDSLNYAFLRVEIRCWQDQREAIDKNRVREFFLAAGAADVDVRILAEPRQNVRAARVMQVKSLRDKLEARAEITGDSLSEPLLAKADMIEAEGRDPIVKKAKEAA